MSSTNIFYCLIFRPLIALITSCMPKKKKEKGWIWCYSNSLANSCMFIVLFSLKSYIICCEIKLLEWGYYQAFIEQYFYFNFHVGLTKNKNTWDSGLDCYSRQAEIPVSVFGVMRFLCYSYERRPPNLISLYAFVQSINDSFFDPLGRLGPRSDWLDLITY